MRILWVLVLDIAQLHYVITACAAASLLYRCLKRAHWQGMLGRGGTHVGRVSQLEELRIGKPKTPFHGNTAACAPCSATLLHSGSAWRLRYAHRDAWREPVHALLGRYSYCAVQNWIRNCSTTFELHKQCGSY